MNTETLADPYGKLDKDATLHMQRLLPGPIDRVWKYLADAELRRQWLASGDLPGAAGEDIELVWHNDELTQPPGQRPEGFGEEHRMLSRVVEIDPPRRLVITWNGSGHVSFDLEARGDEVLLTLTHQRLVARSMQLMVGAGWHAHLDILQSRLQGIAPPPFWDHWSRLRQEYGQRLPAD